MKELMINVRPRKPTAKQRRKGLFSRCVIIFSFLFVSGYTVWAMWEQHRTGLEPTPTLTQWVYTFWGMELIMLCFKRIFAKPSDPRDYEQEG